MTELDDTIPETITEVLDEFGKNVVVTVTERFFEAETNSYKELSKNDYTVKASPPFPYEDKHINGTSIQEGDAQMIIQTPSTFVPKKKQSLTFDGETWVVQRLTKISSGELIAAYILHLRQ